MDQNIHKSLLSQFCNKICCVYCAVVSQMNSVVFVANTAMQVCIAVLGIFPCRKVAVVDFAMLCRIFSKVGLSNLVLLIQPCKLGLSNKLYQSKK